MTLAQHLAELYREFKQDPSPDPQVVVRFTSHLNKIQRKLLTDPSFSALLRQQMTFNSTADRDYYSLPPSIHRIITMRDIANQRPIRFMSESEYRQLCPDPSAESGTPDWYVPLGYYSVARRPSAAVEVFIKSDSASDTQTVYWEVVLATGATRIGSTTLTGTTAVSLDTTLTNISEVQDLYLSSAAVGTISVTETSGAGTQFSGINIGQTRGRFWRVALFPTPAATVTYTVDAERDITDLHQGQDESVLPKRFHDILTDGAEMLEHKLKKDRESFLIARAEYQDGRKALRAYLAGTNAIIPGGTKRIGWSPLGANFPAERWY